MVKTDSVFLTEPDDAELRRLYALPTSGADRTRPFVRANFIATVDGRVTGRDGTSSSINNPADKRVFDLLRSLADTVLVGAGTIREEGYGRIEAGADGGAPDLVVVSNAGDMPGSVLASPTHDGDVPRGRAILATHAAAPQEQDDVTRLICGNDAVDVVSLLSQLHEGGARSVLCEGGPHLLTSLLEAGLVDQLAVTTAPLLVGTAGEVLMTTAPLAADLTWAGGAVIDTSTFALWDVVPSLPIDETA